MSGTGYDDGRPRSSGSVRFEPARAGAVVVALLTTLLAAACSAPATVPAAPVRATALGAAATRAPSSAAGAAPADSLVAPGTARAELIRLARIRNERARTGAGIDTPIGAGDLIEVTVPAMPELTQITVRVGGDGNINLPLLGALPAAGLNERQLAEDLRVRLTTYMHNPQLGLLVKEYRSRQVGVLGSVAKPGLHTMSSGNDTILEMISAAGGLTHDATQRLLFMPVEKVDTKDAQQMWAGVADGDQAASAPPISASGDLLRAGDSVVINLTEMDAREQQEALSVPVRPGDTIVALGGGQVFVQGWVEKPGAYPLTRGLTLLSVIAAAGGPSYPADENSVRIIREDNPTQKSIIVADLQEISNGAAVDVQLREGDVIEISSTGGKLVAYGVYFFFTSVMRVGASVPLF